jgi:hypothetical protein
MGIYTHGPGPSTAADRQGSRVLSILVVMLAYIWFF